MALVLHARTQYEESGVDWSSGGGPYETLADRLGHLDGFLDLDLSELFPTIDGVTATYTTADGLPSVRVCSGIS